MYKPADAGPRGRAHGPASASLPPGADAVGHPGLQGNGVNAVNGGNGAHGASAAAAEADEVPRVPGRISRVALPLAIEPQPNEVTCGATCLHAVYRYWHDDETLDGVIGRMHSLEHGGTFAVYLACDALRKGYSATIYTYNLLVFDPTWFDEGVDIAQKLIMQHEIKPDFRLRHVTEGYVEFLRRGGELKLADLSVELLQSHLSRKIPLLTGLSSTYLYRVAREYGPNDIPDDLRGGPSGHFVVIAGFDASNNSVLVVDPYQPNPYTAHAYWIPADRLIGAVLLGIVTHDANVLVISPP